MIKLILYYIILIFILLWSETNLLSFFLINLIFLSRFYLILIYNHRNVWLNLYSWLGWDGLSFSLIILTIWIIGLIFLTSLNFINFFYYSFNLIVLLIFLFLCFSRINYFIFYLFFEIRLIPVFILLMGWGYQPERIGAGLYIILYTIFASLPMLILIYYLYNYFNSLNYLYLINSFIQLNFFSFLFYLFIIFAFLVKLPLFGFHLWLPKAHIEAPVTGSIVLAGVILKLGGYGLIRSIYFIINLSIFYNIFLFSICLVGIIYLRLLRIRCIDLKLIVAYSSVVHMGIILIGILLISIIGLMGGLLIILGHGLCSSGLFLLVNLSYDRVKSRSIILNKGIILFLPCLTIWWFLFCVINISAPVSLNLLREILILLSLFGWSFNIIFFLVFGIYLSSIYRLYLFSYSQHGIFNTNLIKFNSNELIEFLNLFLHWVPLNFFILKVDFFF